MRLQIARDCFEFGAVFGRMICIQAMVHMVMDQSALGVHYRLFDGMKLLGDLETGLSLLDHLDHRTQVAIGAFQPGHKGRVGCMQMRF